MDPLVPDRARSVAPFRPIDSTATSALHRDIDDLDFHWLVGILEGEGSFLAGPPSRPHSPCVRVVMTDEDIMMRVGSLLARAVVALRTRLPHHRRPYAVSLRGADAARLMASMRHDVGTARQDQIARALADWAQAPTRRPRIVHQLVTDRPTHDASAECEMAWLAGLLEGEGSFTRSSGRGHTYPVVSLEMRSRDIVERAARMLGAPSVTEIPSRNALWSATYRAGLSGADAVVWMQRLRPLMGARRRAAIDDALDRYYPVRLVKPPSRCVVEGCSDAPRARGLCHRHYMSWSRDVARGRAPRVKPLRSN